MAFVTYESISQISPEERNMFQGPQKLLLQSLYDQISVCVRINATNCVIGRIKSFRSDYTISLSNAKLIYPSPVSGERCKESLGEVTIPGDKVMVVVRNKNVVRESPDVGYLLYDQELGFKDSSHVE